MKFLKGLLIVIVVLFGAFCIWMATLSGDYEVSRSEVIDAKPEVVYSNVSDFKTWPQWSIWFEKDSTMKTTWGDKTQGVGASYSWTSENSGSGTQSITDAEANQELETHISFDGMGESDGYWKFEEVEGGKTKVTWGFTGSFPFLMRFMAAGMDAAVGPDFEGGLANLKEMIESMPKKQDVEVVMVDAEPMEYYSTTDEIAISKLDSKFFGQCYEEIGTYLGDGYPQNMTGAPFVIYHKWDPENDITKIEVSIPAQSDKPGSDRVKKGNSYEGKALKAVYMGPYEGLGEVHYAIDDYAKNNGISIVGGPWEVYITDPSSEPDTSKWITEVYYPVAMAQDDDAAEEQSM